MGFLALALTAYNKGVLLCFRRKTEDTKMKGECARQRKKTRMTIMSFL